MASRLAALLLMAGLVASGVAAGMAWRHGMWGLLTGAALAAVWLGALGTDVPARVGGRGDRPAAGEGGPIAHRLVLDAAPTPLLAIEGDMVRALNRAARRLFATDDRVLPPPAALVDAGAGHLAHEGRRWRIDRVALAGGGRHTVAALVDVEGEARAAEARATAELIHVLGHELLNGLAPIVSLADSALQAVDAAPRDTALLREILDTLARRAEGLERFTTAYRALARLPEPVPRPVTLAMLADDLARLFEGRWPGVSLALEVDDATWAIDRDQLTQALWALLQNAAEAAVAAHGAGARVVLAMSAARGGLAIEVRDNGAGVPPAAAARIFRPFHTTKPEGTGVGLSLARQIAHGHGGTLALAAPSPATFRLVLPAPS